MLVGEKIEVRKGFTKRKIRAPLASVEVEKSEAYVALKFSGEGNYLALGGRRIEIYSCAAGYALVRTVDRQVQALDWSTGGRYLRYRWARCNHSWDLKHNESSDFDEKWVTAATALEEDLASCFVGTDVLHATKDGEFMLASETGESQQVLGKGSKIMHVSASRYALKTSQGGPNGLSPPQGPQSPSGTTRLIVSVDAKSAIIIWSCTRSASAEITPSSSPVPVSPMAACVLVDLPAAP
jgi:hypothetical protein